MALASPRELRLTGHECGSSEGSAELHQLRPSGLCHPVLARTEEGRGVPVPPRAAWCPRQQC